MALPDNMARIQISLDKELLERVQDWCDKEHMTKSNYFALLAETALASGETLPMMLSDAFVRSAMTAEIRSQMRAVIAAERELEAQRLALGLA